MELQLLASLIFLFMKKRSKPSPADEVEAYIKGLEPALAEIVQTVRQIILSADARIAEQIKWNAPAFQFTGDMQPFDPKEYKRDIAVMNLRRGHLLLIFPTGARIRDSSGLLQGDYADGRRMITYRSAEEAKSAETALLAIVRDWLS